MGDRCRVVVGRLIAHPCARPSQATCPTCRLPVCDIHLSGSEDGRCRVCTDDVQPPKAPIVVDFKELMDFSQAEVEAFEGETEGPGVGLMGS